MLIRSKTIFSNGMSRSGNLTPPSKTRRTFFYRPNDSFTSSSFLKSLLEKDFEDLKDRQGYDYIELQLDFAMDLYPFFPPLVKVIRPRLQGSMMLRVTTMEILKLSYWNPARNMKEVLVDIKAFLQTWARLDCKSERNDRSRYPDGAYIDIEHHLLRLALGKNVKKYKEL